MKYFSMFTGIGGFELGIERAYNKQLAENEQDRERRNRDSNEQPILLCSSKNSPLCDDETQNNRNQSNLFGRWEQNTRSSQNLQCGRSISSNETAPQCVGYSEIDKYAIQTYEKNFRGTKNYGDATKIKPEELPDFDMLCGGFPCQAFSIAGRRKGFEDTRGTLFFDIARILKVKRPKIVFLENVKGLLNHNKGETFKVILQTLDELGYEVQWMVLNSKFFGVPQNRERVFIIGSLRGTSRPEILPFGIPTEEYTQEVQGVQSPTLKSRDYKDGGKWLGDIRRLTPTECERLQGYPDGWTEGVSDTQRYKQLGNSVTVNVIEAIMTSLLSQIKNNEN